MTLHLATAEDFKKANLSYYTLCKLAEAIGCVNPAAYVPATRQPIELTVDDLGNYQSFTYLQKTV